MRARKKTRRPALKVNSLHELFRAYMKEQGMTSADIAEVMDCAPESVRRQMSRPGRLWKIGKLIEYSDVLGIPYDVAFKAASQK